MQKCKQRLPEARTGQNCNYLRQVDIRHLPVCLHILHNL
jgi:hypothetical protein